MKYLDPSGKFVITFGVGFDVKALAGVSIERGAAVGLDTRPGVPVFERFSVSKFETTGQKLSSNAGFGGTFGLGFTFGAQHVTDIGGESIGGAVSADLGLSAGLEVSAGPGAAGFKVSAGLGLGAMPVEAEVSKATTQLYNVIGEKYNTGPKCFGLHKIEGGTNSQSINIPSDPIASGWNNISPMWKTP